MLPLWTIQLLGRLAVRSGERTITRFETRQTGALLAYLSFYGQRPHGREIVAAICWPSDPPEIARRKLRIALSSLRRQLEPPGVGAGTVLLTTRTDLQLHPAAYTTDVAAFEVALEAAARTSSQGERQHHLEEAVSQYRGELLPQRVDEWIVPERLRLEEAYLQALGELVRLLEEAGEISRALHWAQRSVAIDPLREEGHHDVMRLLVAAGQPDAALRQYAELERLLRQELGMVPEANGRRLAEIAGARAQRSDTQPPSLEPAASAAVRHPSPHTRPGTPSAFPASLSTGIATLLMTEIEGSPALRSRAGAALPQILAAHDRLIREAAARHGGQEIRKYGDSFVIHFRRAAEGWAAAIAAQRALTEHPWPAEAGPVRVRMGLRTGDVEEGIPGPLLHRLTRLTLAAHGGQILLCEVTAALLREHPEPDLRLGDLGLFRLRAGARPERLFQAIPSEGDLLPPPKAAPALQAQLPLVLTRFFGRAEEVTGLRQLLEGGGCRLVTLTGPGGSGKTRLALEVAACLRPPLQGAVWFVPLAAETEARRVPEAIWKAMRLPGSVPADPLKEVVEALSHQPSLLVLDNFEQLAVEGAFVIYRLLSRIPTLRCLVTSRGPLGLPGEREFPVECLLAPPPDPGCAGSDRRDLPHELLQYPSVQLFVDRAQAARPSFQLTLANAAAVAGICARLEGLPLALELAAAQARAFTPAQTLTRLERPLDTLVSRTRPAEPRHQSLAAALDVSYQLLSPELQRLFARLAVFRGGCTPEAAQVVCGEGVGDGRLELGSISPPPVPPTPTLEHLVQLRQASLLLVEESGAELRHRMLEPIREYAAEQLQRSGFDTMTRRRHLKYFRALAEEAEPNLKGPEQAEWLARLEREHDNLRSALTWSEGSGATPEGQADVEAALRMGVALSWFWLVRGYLGEGQEHLGALLALAGAAAPTAIRARALNAAGTIAHWRGDLPNARRWLQESVALLRERGDRAGLAVALTQWGHMTLNSGEYQKAWELFAETRALSEALDDPHGAAAAQANLGNVAFWRGDLAMARALHEASLAAMRALDDPWSAGYALERLGIVALDERDYPTARRHYVESLLLYRELEGRSGIANCLRGLAVVAAAAGDPDRAARLFGAAVGVIEPAGQELFPPPGHPFHPRDPAIPFADRLRHSHAAAWAAGHALPMEAAIALALEETAVPPR